MNIDGDYLVDADGTKLRLRVLLLYELGENLVFEGLRTLLEELDYLLHLFEHLLDFLLLRQP